MTKPAQIWNAERLERAMLSEAASHGANKRDLSLLQSEFRKLKANNNPNNRPQLDQIEITDIPS
jgi:hypothetical protein